MSNRNFMQKAFLEWNAHNVERTTPLWQKPTYKREQIILKLWRFTPHIKVTLHKYGARILLDWFGDVWDLLYDMDLIVSRSDDGRYICELCSEKDRRYFDTEALLWQEHVFEPLSSWIEENVQQAQVARLVRRCGARWVTFDEHRMEEIGVRYTIHAPS